MSEETKTNNTNKSFVQKVLEFFKGGEEAKIVRFQKRYIKENNRQIKIREDEIDELNDKLSDLKEKQQEDLISVDFDRIKDTDSLKRYIDDYRAKQVDNLVQKDGIKALIEDAQNDIDLLKELNSQVS